MTAKDKPALQVTTLKLPVFQGTIKKVMNPQFIDISRVASKAKALSNAKNA